MKNYVTFNYQRTSMVLYRKLRNFDFYFGKINDTFGKRCFFKITIRIELSV